MASIQSSNINSDNYNVVTLENGSLLLSEDGNLCLQNRFDGSLCMVTPTNDVLNAFDITLSEIVNTDHVEQSSPSSSTDHVKQTALLSPTDHVEQSALSSSTVCSSKFEVTNNEPCDGNIPNKRGKWSKNAILMLINLRIEHNNDFTSTTQKNDVTWKLISNKLKLNGVEMTPTQCNDKWRYLKGKYTAAKDNRGDRGSGEEPIDFSYFEILDEFLGKKHNVKPIAVASSIRGDTVPKEHADGTDALQEDSDGHNDVSTDAPLETPKKKFKAQIAQRVKQNKSGLCAVWDDMKRSRADREQNKERRHQELINVRNRAIDVFAMKMDQFMEKFTK